MLVRVANVHHLAHARSASRSSCSRVLRQPSAQRRRPTPAHQTLLCDHQVWRIEKFEAVELEVDEFGSFSSGDCYIVLYTYGPQKSDFIMYMWQGAQSTQDERGACALSAAKIDEDLCHGSATQVCTPSGPQAQ
jgi:hypothetical protein